MVAVIAIFDIGKTNKKFFLFDEQYKIVVEKTETFAEIVTNSEIAHEQEKSENEESDEDIDSDSKTQAGGTEVSESGLETKSFTDEAYRKNEKKLSPEGISETMTTS